MSKRSKTASFDFSLIEKNLDRMKNKSIPCKNFAEIVESLKDIIEFKEEK